MNIKDKDNLSHFYETDEYKSFVKFCDEKRLKVATQILSVPMGEPGAVERICMLQGQYNALEFLQLEIKKIHKERTSES